MAVEVPDCDLPDPAATPDRHAGPRLDTGPRTSHALVIDDDTQMRTLLSNVLVEVGFTPHLLHTGSEVEAALARWVPEVILLDLSLGDSDAIEVIQTIAALHFGGNVLLVSGHDASTLSEVRMIGERRGLRMLPPLQKPFRIGALRAQLKGILNGASDFGSGTTLAAALDNDWLELWYQPKIDLRTMQVRGAEGLVRMNHPNRGIVSPCDFLPDPGDALYWPLTDFVVGRAMDDWSRFAALGMRDRLAINIPASVLQRPDFVRSIRRHLPADPDFPGLMIEITEHEAIGDLQRARQIAVQLKLYNLLISIDDFGVGYSTLARLQELPFAEIKLDRQFVDGCSTTPRKRALCEIVVALARRFDMVAVAEGVETEDDLRVLVDVGFPVAQGFLLAKPMAAADFAEFLSGRTTSSSLSPPAKLGS